MPSGPTDLATPTRFTIGIQSSGVAGRVNVSEATWASAETLFVCEARGAIEAKNKGPIPMYFVHSIRPELSVDGAGLVPNDALRTRRAVIEASPWLFLGLEVDVQDSGAVHTDHGEGGLKMDRARLEPEEVLVFVPRRRGVCEFDRALVVD